MKLNTKTTVTMDENIVVRENETKARIDLAGIKILVAEDEDSSYKIINKIFSEHDIDILRAVNGKEAVDIVSSNPNIQLVLMDIKMPVMNGIQATKEIKQIRPELPVIATSAFAMPGDKQIFKDAGCEDYLSKPVKADLLISLIRRYV